MTLYPGTAKRKYTNAAAIQTITEKTINFQYANAYENIFLKSKPSSSTTGVVALSCCCIVYYFRMLYIRDVSDIRIEVAENHNEVDEPISEFFALDSLGVT